MPISQKPNDVLHITYVQIKKLTFLSHNLGKTNDKNAPKVSKAASKNDVSISTKLYKTECHLLTIGKEPY